MRERRCPIDLGTRDDVDATLGPADGSAAGAEGPFISGGFIVRKMRVLERQRADRRNILNPGNRIGSHTKV